MACLCVYAPWWISCLTWAKVWASKKTEDLWIEDCDLATENLENRMPKIELTWQPGRAFERSSQPSPRMDHSGSGTRAVIGGKGGCKNPTHDHSENRASQRACPPWKRCGRFGQPALVLWPPRTAPNSDLLHLPLDRSLPSLMDFQPGCAKNKLWKHHWWLPLCRKMQRWNRLDKVNKQLV